MNSPIRAVTAPESAVHRVGSLQRLVQIASTTVVVVSNAAQMVATVHGRRRRAPITDRVLAAATGDRRYRRIVQHLLAAHAQQLLEIVAQMRRRRRFVGRHRLQRTPHQRRTGQARLHFQHTGAGAAHRATSSSGRRVLRGRRSLLDGAGFGVLADAVQLNAAGVAVRERSRVLARVIRNRRVTRRRLGRGWRLLLLRVALVMMPLQRASGGLRIEVVGVVGGVAAVSGRRRCGRGARAARLRLLR